MSEGSFISARSPLEEQSLMDWCLQAFLPIAVVAFRWFRESDNFLYPVLPPSSTANEATIQNSRTLLLIITLSSLAALLQPFTTSPVLALGLSSAASTTLAYTLLESILGVGHDDGTAKREDERHANGSHNRRLLLNVPTTLAPSRKILEELAAVISIGCGCASLCLENFRFNGMEYHPNLGGLVGEDWRTGMRRVGILQGLMVAVAAGLKNVVMIALVSSFRSRFTKRLMGKSLHRVYTSISQPLVTRDWAIVYRELALWRRK